MPTPAPGAAGFKDMGMVSLLLLEMGQRKERLGSVQAFLEHIPCRCKWQTSPLVAFPPLAQGSSSWFCVHKEHTSPGSLPVPVPRETGTVPAWHGTSVQGASRNPAGGVTKSQTCGKTTQTHPLRIFPHLEPSSVTGESVGGPESP